MRVGKTDACQLLGQHFAHPFSACAQPFCLFIFTFILKSIDIRHSLMYEPISFASVFVMPTLIILLFSNFSQNCEHTVDSQSTKKLYPLSHLITQQVVFRCHLFFLFNVIFNKQGMLVYLIYGFYAHTRTCTGIIYLFDNFLGSSEKGHNHIEKFDQHSHTFVLVEHTSFHCPFPKWYSSWPM